MKAPALAALAALLTAASGEAFAQAANRLPITAIDGGARWMESRAWGGGVRTLIDLPERQRPGEPSLSFLGGAAPEFTLGCSSPQPDAGRWRFRAGFSPPGAVIGRIPGAERAYETGVANATGAAGVVILRDEKNQEFRRFPLQPANSGLETGALSPADMKAFTDASAIRVVTPRLVLEAASHDLGLELKKLSRSPCGRI